MKYDSRHIDHYKNILSKKIKGLEYYEHLLSRIKENFNIDPNSLKDINKYMSKRDKRPRKSKKYEDSPLEQEPQTRKKFHTKDMKNINPLTENQRIFFEEYNSTDKHFVLEGSAGVGKTFLSLYKLLYDVLDKRYDKLVIIRSSVQSGRDMGALPGTIEEKMAEFEKPFVSVCDDLFTYKKSYENLKKAGLIEFQSTSFLRGETFSNCAIFVDECKNMNMGELDTILTRVGENSRIIFGGDKNFQNDLTRNKYDVSWFNEFLKIIKRMDEHFSIIHFTHADIVRSQLVKDYIILRDSLMLNTFIE